MSSQEKGRSSLSLGFKSQHGRDFRSLNPSFQVPRKKMKHSPCQPPWAAGTECDGLEGKCLNAMRFCVYVSKARFHLLERSHPHQ